MPTLSKTHDREVGWVSSVIETRDIYSEESDQEVEMMTSEADTTKRENTPLVSGIAASTTLSAENSVQSWVSFDPKSRGPFYEGLGDALAASLSTSCSPDQQFISLCAWEAKPLAEYIPEPQRATLFRGHTCTEKTRLKGDDYTRCMVAHG